ncbi:MAG: alpha/beta fold hydrolase, partial [Bacteroidota bacterium]
QQLQQLQQLPPMKWIKRLAITAVLIYLVIGALLFAFQESLLFHPRPRPDDHRYGDYEELWFPLEDGKRLHALRLPGTTAQRNGVVLYLHGNVGDNGRSIYQTRTLAGTSYDRILVDYRGFGKSEGKIDGEEDLTTDFQAVYDQLKKEYPENKIIVAGYSMGSGPASFLAANNHPAGVVLVAPYTSLVDMKNEFFWMFPDFLMKYDLNNRKHLAAASCPVHILHGTADELIPYRMGETLASLDPDRITLEAIPGAGHRRAVLSEAFGRAVKVMIERFE